MSPCGNDINGFCGNRVLMASTLLRRPCLPIRHPGLKLSIHLLWGRCSGTETSFCLSLHNLKVFGNFLLVKMEQWLLKAEGCRGHGEQTCACPWRGKLCLPSDCAQHPGSTRYPEQIHVVFSPCCLAPLKLPCGADRCLSLLSLT